MLSENHDATKDSNYYPLVVTYRCNSIFANNAKGGVRWARSFSASQRILDIIRGACSNSVSTRETHISGPVVAFPCFWHVTSEILNT